MLILLIPTPLSVTNLTGLDRLDCVVEALRRFAEREPLRRDGECAVEVLPQAMALASEPVGPRL